MAGAERPGAEDGLAHRREHRLDAVDRLRSTADHNGERAVDGALDPTRDGRIDERETCGDEFVPEGARAKRRRRNSMSITIAPGCRCGRSKSTAARTILPSLSKVMTTSAPATDAAASTAAAPPPLANCSRAEASISNPLTA